MKQTTEFTRKDYMNNVCTHNEYYSQFITPGIISLVSIHIGEEKIKTSTDEHMNDIPLKEWDDLNNFVRESINVDKWLTLACPDMIGKKSTNGFNRMYSWSLCDGVCIAKAAAKQIQQGGGE